MKFILKKPKKSRERERERKKQAPERGRMEEGDAKEKVRKIVEAGDAGTDSLRNPRVGVGEGNDNCGERVGQTARF